MQIINAQINCTISRFSLSFNIVLSIRKTKENLVYEIFVLTYQSDK